MKNYLCTRQKLKNDIFMSGHIGNTKKESNRLNQHFQNPIQVLLIGSVVRRRLNSSSLAWAKVYAGTDHWIDSSSLSINRVWIRFIGTSWGLCSMTVLQILQKSIMKMQSDTFSFDFIVYLKEVSMKHIMIDLLNIVYGRWKIVGLEMKFVKMLFESGV